MREVANSKPRTRLNELLPCHYLDYDENEDIELIKQVDSISSYVEHPVPDHWMRYMIDLMRDRVIWIGATNRGELIGITRHGFEKLTHRSSPVRPEVCTCQASNLVSSEWNGPMVIWPWAYAPVTFMTSFLPQFLMLEVQDADSISGPGGRGGQRCERRYDIKHRIEVSSAWQEWRDHINSSMTSLMQSDTSRFERETAIQKLSAEVIFTTLTAYVDGYGDDGPDENE